MFKVLLLGNPNVGKSTLFNSLTKSSEHTGNFHGVTVEEKRKVVKFEKDEYEFVDLPGMYSLNSFSYEERVARDIVLNENACRLMVLDANSLRHNLYLCLQLDELNLDYKILINNYDYFKKRKNEINIDKLSKKLDKKIEIINAKKIKINKNLFNFNENNVNNLNFKEKNTNFFNFPSKNLLNNKKSNDIDNVKIENNNKNIIFIKNNIKNSENLSKFNKNIQKNPYLYKIILEIKQKTNLDENKIIYALNGIDEGIGGENKKTILTYLERVIEARYKYIDELLTDCVKQDKNYIYGSSRADKFLLNPFVMTLGFFILFLLAIYIIFFLVGDKLSELLNLFVDKILFTPFMNFMYLHFDNIWAIEFFRGGVFSAFSIVLSFLPQVVLLFIFLTIIEDSGIISRMAYVFDDVLEKVGLNGKAIYIMLLGLGCNTMSAMATRNMNTKNLKIKTAILNPFISCMARLPVFMLVASAFFGEYAFLVIAGLYLLGIILLLIVAKILNKTILPTKSSELLIEFPPIRLPDFKHILVVAKINAIDMIKRVFSIVLSCGIIVWILTHTTFTFVYTDIIEKSILYIIASKFSFIFAPIGLNLAGIVLALIVGVLAKEMILSTFAICNNSLDNLTLISTLTLTTSVIHFNMSSAVSFLIFSLIYAPCVSTMAVIKHEAGKGYMWLGLLAEFTLAYMLAFVVYQSIERGIMFALFAVILISIIVISIIYLARKIRDKKVFCLFCNKCKRK